MTPWHQGHLIALLSLEKLSQPVLHSLPLLLGTSWVTETPSPPVLELPETKINAAGGQELTIILSYMNPMENTSWLSFLPIVPQIGRNTSSWKWKASDRVQYIGMIFNSCWFKFRSGTHQLVVENFLLNKTAEIVRRGGVIGVPDLMWLRKPEPHQVLCRFRMLILRGHHRKRLEHLQGKIHRWSSVLNSVSSGKYLMLGKKNLQWSGHF